MRIYKHNNKNKSRLILLSETIKNKMYTPVIFLVVLLTCETWQRMVVIDKRVLMKIFGLKREEVQVAGENYILRNFMIYTSNQILFQDKIKEDEFDRAQYMCGKEQKCIQYFGGET